MNLFQGFPRRWMVWFLGGGVTYRDGILGALLAWGLPHLIYWDQRISICATCTTLYSIIFFSIILHLKYTT